MLNLPFNSKSNEERQAGVLRVVGDRASGKTTYMAALARWKNANSTSPVKSVVAANEEGKELIDKAQDILEQGEELTPTGREVRNVIEIKDYRLTIVLKKPSVLTNSQSVLHLDVSCKDYPGEFFSQELRKTGSPLLQEYLNDCAEATGIMMFVDGIANRKDSEYAIMIERLLVHLDQAALNVPKRRIALVVSKCELPELWVNRYAPRFVAEARFPESCKKLEGWQESGAGKVEYFTVSAFGMLGNIYQKPNSKQKKRDRDGVTSVLIDAQNWRPFGLVSPIYWLCTGKRYKELDED